MFYKFYLSHLDKKNEIFSRNSVNMFYYFIIGLLYIFYIYLTKNIFLIELNDNNLIMISIYSSTVFFVVGIIIFVIRLFSLQNFEKKYLFSLLFLNFFSGFIHYIRTLNYDFVINTHYNKHVSILEYFEWIITVPLLQDLESIFLLCDDKLRKNMIYSSFIMLITGFYSTFFTGFINYLLLFISFSAFIFINFSKIYMGFIIYPTVIINNTSSILSSISTILWSCFPIAFLLSKFNYITYNNELIIYTILDVCSKFLFSLILIEFHFNKISIKLIQENSKNYYKNEKQNKLLQNLFYDLRSPLNALVLGLDHISNELNTTDQQYKTIISNLTISTQYLQRIFEDVLLICKQDKYNIELLKKPFNLFVVLSNAIKPFETYGQLNYIKNLSNLDQENLSNNKIIKIQLHYDPLIPSIVIGDEYRLTQIINNLLSNSVKFTNNECIINVYCTLIKTVNNIVKIRFCIEDNGVGITQDNIDKICKEYEQVNIIDSAYGFGLGLSIVKSLLELHNSKLEINSIVNNGSNFSFDINYQVEENLFDDQIAIIGTDRQIHIKSDESNFKVLIVDDMLTNRTIIRLILENNKISCDEAYDGIDALEKVNKTHYDLIIMDGRMPRLNGIEATKQIIENSKNKDICPIILGFTGSFNNDWINKFLSAGATDVLYKPINKQKLIEKIKEFQNKIHNKNL
jgi:signal transduction histidine kinase/CheY-like chemotaxis protein